LKRVPYESGHTQFATDAETAIEIGKGVCQDHANIFVSAARSVGLPARYVSGYLMMDDRVDQDASHAWAEVHLKDLGWVGFDVSNGVSPDERYARIAIGRDAHDAAPIYGLRGGTGDERLVVSLQVQQ
ncbi:MAG: transglutaminase family protein, partial [Roseobacter sp.]